MSRWLLNAARIGGPLLIFSLGACGGTPSGDTAATAAPNRAGTATVEAAHVATVEADAVRRIRVTVEAIISPVVPRSTASYATGTAPAAATPASSTVRPSSLGTTDHPTVRSVASIGSPQAPTAVATAGSSARLYTDPNGRFSFDIPAGWRIVIPAQPTTAVQVAPSDLHGATTVTTEPVAPATTLDQYVSATLEGIGQEFPQLRLLSPGIQQTGAGQESERRYEFEGQLEGQSVYVSQVVRLKDAVVYVLTSTCLKSEQPMFMRGANTVAATFHVPARP